MGHNGGMFVSAEAISLILVAAGVLITIGGGCFAGLAWVVRRMDEGFDKADERMNERFAKVDERFDKMDERMRQVQSELNDVKVAVARVGGPHQRLIFPR